MLEMSLDQSTILKILLKKMKYNLVHLDFTNSSQFKTLLELLKAFKKKLVLKGIKNQI
jgi:hypothetical protein